MSAVCLPAWSWLEAFIPVLAWAVDSGLPVQRFRLRCGVPLSCVCQRQFGLIYKLLTHSALDPTSAAGMAIPCVGGGGSTWVVLHWWGSDVVLLISSRSSGEPTLQTAWRESAFRTYGSRFWVILQLKKQKSAAVVTYKTNLFKFAIWWLSLVQF